MDDPLTFANAAEWEAWLAAHHDTAADAWLRIAKKGSGVTTVTIREALDLALCYGWIDSQRKSYDDTYYLQRYTRRRPRSEWSKVNVDRVAELTAAGRMRAPGLAEVAAARADGRWEAAYQSQRTAEVPPDLAAALAEQPAARAAFDALSKTDRYLMILQLLKARTTKTRTARLERIIDTLTNRR